MPRIHVCSMSEVLAQLPALQPWQRDASVAGDLLVCANGFEPRAVTVTEALVGGRSRFSRTAYVSYSTNVTDNEALRQRLVGALREVDASGEPLEIHESRVGSVLKGLLNELPEAVGAIPKVFIDVSVASNRLIMLMIRAAIECARDVDVTVLYSEAGVYHPTQQEHAANKQTWTTDRFGGLEWGVGDVDVASDEYPGYHIDQLPDFVVVIPGYNRDRVRAVISHADPALLPPSSDTYRRGGATKTDGAEERERDEQHVAWLLGEPHLPEDLWRREAQREIHNIEPRALEIGVSTFDYRDTIRVLEGLYEQRRGVARFSLSPMGSKMQAVGAALFCHMRPDVRVLFAKPQQYNAAQYSEGCKATWMLELGPMSALKREMLRVDLIRLVD